MLVITTIFDGSVVDVRYLDGRVERRGFVLGIDRCADQVCDAALLPSTHHTLVRTRGGWFQIAIFDGPEGFDGFYRDGEEVLSLSALRANGLLIPAEDEPRISLFEIPRRGELDLTLGLLRVVIATAERPLRVPRRRSFDDTLLRPVAAVALLTSMVAAMVAALPPMPRLLRLPEDARARLGIAPPRTMSFLIPSSTEQGMLVRAWGNAGLSLRDLGVPGMGRPDCILKADRPRSDRRTPGSAPSTQPAPGSSAAAASSPETRSLMEGLLAGSTLGAEAEAALHLFSGVKGRGGGEGTAVLRTRTQTRKAIRRVVRQHRNEIRSCYERALQHDETLAGRVTVRFSLGLMGTVLRSEVLDTTLPIPEVGACIAAAFQRWQFPSMGQAIEVHYPVQLKKERTD